MLPDAFDGERLFFRGRALPLAPEAFDVRVHDDGRASLLYVDLDQLQAYLEEHPGLSHEPASVEPGVSVSVDNTVVVEDGDDIPF